MDHDNAPWNTAPFDPHTLLPRVSDRTVDYWKDPKPGHLRGAYTTAECDALATDLPAMAQELLGWRANTFVDPPFTDPYPDTHLLHAWAVQFSHTRPPFGDVKFTAALSIALPSLALEVFGYRLTAGKLWNEAAA